MKRILFLLVGFAAITANAEGRFRYAVFAGEQNYSSDVWQSQTIVDSPSVMYSNGYGSTYTTFAYATFMRFRANRQYMFRGSWDDYAAMKIDGQLVLNTRFLGQGACSITFPSNGYHRIELFVSNAGGWYGYDPNNGYSFLGIEFSEDAGVTWKRFGDVSDDHNKFVLARPTVEILSSSIRATDETILDVTYIVRSREPVVRVRALAFEDGERSFTKVVRPETFVTDTNGVETACNVGDNVTPNVEHTISWRVSSDWKTKLAKVKFEVLACEGELLPLELMTIPASDQYGKMKISWNAISSSQWFDALLWLYADKDAGLKLENGLLKVVASNDTLANGTSITTEISYHSYYNKNGTYVGSHYETQQSAPQYIFNKMGYSLLTGAPLTYANGETRLGLSPSGARQYAYKIVEE